MSPKRARRGHSTTDTGDKPERVSGDNAGQGEQPSSNLDDRSTVGQEGEHAGEDNAAGGSDESVAVTSDGEDEGLERDTANPWPDMDGNIELIGGEESNSSTDDDEVPNPVGGIPMKWYEDMDHLGYDRDGKQISKPEGAASAKARSLRALERMRAGGSGEEIWRVVYDEKTGEELVLNDEEVAMVRKVQKGQVVRIGSGEDEEVIAWTGPVITGPSPLPQPTEPKRRFVPSKHESARVVKMVRAMRKGWMEKPSERSARRAAESKEYTYDVWKEDEIKSLAEMTKAERAREKMRAPPPKMKLPGSEESYNPPAEFLPSREEIKAWTESEHPEDRERDFLPQKFDTLRHVPAYPNSVKERFERCLDLYLAVRVRKQKMQVDPDDLLPKLPKPSDLRPFPTRVGSVFGPTDARSRCISVHPNGQWLLTGSDDGYARVWSIATGKCRVKYLVAQDKQPVVAVGWRPIRDELHFAAGAGKTIVVISCVKDVALPGGAEGLPAVDKAIESKTTASVDWQESTYAPEDGSAAHAIWKLTVAQPRAVKHISWHPRGDYFAVAARDHSGSSLALHRLSQRLIRTPFSRKAAGGIQAGAFHPSQPIFFLATQHHVRVYDLSTQQLVKTLTPGARWISSISVHPSGDHVLVGSYDKHLYWFDLDLSTQPYRVLRNHKAAIRTVSFHPRLPLFADASDDATAHVFHATVHSDLMQNALIVPVKMLKNYHSMTQSLGILDIAWHPTQPWLFSTGADGQIKLFVE